MLQYGTALCILSFTACLLKPQGILNSQGRFAFVSKSIHLVIQCHLHVLVVCSQQDEKLTMMLHLHCMCRNVLKNTPKTIFVINAIN